MSQRPNRNPKLLFLQHDSIFENFGGVQYYLDDLLTYAAETLGPDNVRAIVPQKTASFHLQNRPYKIRVVPFKNGRLRKLENRFSPRYFVQAFKEIKTFKPTLLVASHLHFAPLTYALSKTTKTPYVVLAYGFEVWGDFFPQDKWALMKADGIVSISQWTKSLLLKQGFRRSPISIVHPGLNTHFAQAPLTQKKSNPELPLRLLTISRLDSAEQYKGQDHVIEALALLRKSSPEIKISYTIQGNGSDLPRLKGLVEKYALENQVHFQSAVQAREQLRDSYQNHDVFIMPSRFGRWEGKWRGEGFGIVYLEAAAHGLPSIAYDCGGATDIIFNEKNGLLVKPDNVQALADGILRLALNREYLTDLGKEAYRSTLERFSPQAIKNEVQLAFKT